MGLIPAIPLTFCCLDMRS